MDFTFTLEQIAQLVEASTVDGSTNQPVNRITALKQASPGDLSFLGNKKYTPEVATCRASILLLPLDFEGSPAADQAYVRVKNPSLALATLCGEIERRLHPTPTGGIHPSAVVATTASVDPSAAIGPHCVIEDGTVIGAGTRLDAQVYVGRSVTIGAQCRIRPHVTLGDYSVLGDRVSIHAGVVIGSDGFGYETVQGVHQKVPQIGNVIIEDDVEIGANTCIDRARFSSTRIGKGTKIDNLVQIGHNVETGTGCILVAQSGISGSTVLEDYVITAGQSGVAGHLRLGKGTILAAQAGLQRDTQPGDKLFGTPAIEVKLAHRTDVLKKRLPELFKRVAKLEEGLKGSE